MVGDRWGQEAAWPKFKSSYPPATTHAPGPTFPICEMACHLWGLVLPMSFEGWEQTASSPAVVHLLGSLALVCCRDCHPAVPLHTHPSPDQLLFCLSPACCDSSLSDALEGLRVLGTFPAHHTRAPAEPLSGVTRTSLFTSRMVRVLWQSSGSWNQLRPLSLRPCWMSAPPGGREAGVNARRMDLSCLCAR